MEYPRWCYDILDSVFDNLFELDFNSRTLRNLHSNSNILCCSAGSIRMVLDDALDAWINNDVHEDDRQNVRNIFAAAESENTEKHNLRTHFRLKDADSEIWYSGVIIKLEDNQGWFGFYEISDQKSIELLQNIFEEKKQHLEWESKRGALWSRAGVVVIDYDFQNQKFWASKGYDRYKCSEKPLGYVIDNLNSGDYVYSEDYETFSLFMERIKSHTLDYTDETFRMLMSSGEYLWTQVGASMFYDEERNVSRIMLSFRCVDDEKKKEIALEFSQRYLRKLLNSTGNDIFTFTIDDDGNIHIPYLTTKCSRYFGITPSEFHLHLANDEIVEQILPKMPLTNEQFMLLIKEGNYDFEITDVEGNKGLMSFICKKMDDIYYVSIVSPEEMEQIKFGRPKNRLHDINITTFGFFDIFVDGNPVLFKNEKSKELLALLVDRRGGYISSPEAISCLWEDEPVNEYTLARYRKTAMKLKNTLAEYGVEYIIESVNGKRRLAIDEVECDLYNYLSGKPSYANLFHGIYMTNYSWSEITLASLEK